MNSKEKNRAITDTNPELLDYNNKDNGKTILSRKHILNTCKREVKLAMLPVFLVMLTICVSGTFIIVPTSDTIGIYALLLLWIIGIITITIQFLIMKKSQKAIGEAHPMGSSTIYLARSRRMRRYACHFKINGKDRKVPSGALGQIRLFGEEDVYILMINDKITAVYPEAKYSLDTDLLGKMSVV